MPSSRLIRVICNAAGRFQPLPAALADPPPPDAAALSELVAPISMGRCESFLHALREERFICDWRLDVMLDGAVTGLQFAGGQIGADQYLIVGTTDADAFIPFY